MKDTTERQIVRNFKNTLTFKHFLSGRVFLISFSWLINYNSQDSRALGTEMNIFSQALAIFTMITLTASPFISEAWFFSTAQAQEGVTTTDIVNNTQTIDLLAPRIAYAYDLMPDDGAFVDILDDAAMDPNIGASGTLADVIDEGENILTSVYVVQPGDSVASVAKRFGISENTLRYANNMKKTDVLHRGDMLLILSVTGIRYTVKSGDTLNSIAKKYKLGAEDFAGFLDYNNLEASSALRIGEQLIIPGVDLEPSSPSASSSKSSSKAKTQTTSSSSANVTRGYFIRPVPSSSCRMSQGKHDRYAIDLACPAGTPIKASASGTVIRAQYGWNGGYGNLVVIQHPNGMITFYAHILAGGIKVSQGDQVKQGQVIGLVGSTGRSTGNHVHFEVRNGVNPGFDKTGSAWKQ